MNNSALKLTVCIGSSCHVKGSHQVVEQFKDLIAKKDLGDKVELCGTFCLGQCQQGVCVTIGEQVFSVSPESAAAFFETEVLTRI